MATVSFAVAKVALAMFYPMPFFRGARVRLVGAGTAVAGVSWENRDQALPRPPGRVAYFHATYVDQGAPVPATSLVLLDTTQTEGGGDWCAGHFAGTSFTSDAAVLGTLGGRSALLLRR